MRAQLLAASLLLALSCRTAGPQDSVPPPARRPLPDIARVAVLPKMQGHAQDMSSLLWSMLFLDDFGTRAIAYSIANEPRLARPTSPLEGTANTQLPEAYFALQDELVEKAQALLAVASKPEHDPSSIARAYGELAATCVKCHAQFMYGPDDERPTFDELAAEE